MLETSRKVVVFVTFCSAIWASCAKISTPGQGGTGAANGTDGGSGSDLSRSIDSVTLSDAILMTCGNGQLDPTEVCDDGNKMGGDGCTPLCQIESDWRCPTVGQPCVSTAVCGDGALSASEACDDGNTNSGDGCSSDCRNVEVGFQCRVGGKKCVPLCGDGMVIGSEKCDDKNDKSGDGCSSTCLLEPGASCPTPGQPCSLATCGNGKVEEGESCDAGPLNGLFFGNGTGCSKTCTTEPKCRDGATTRACDVSCGNGNIEAGEECDDGNRAKGDGCGPDCKTETGFTCGGEMKPDTEACSAPASTTDKCLKLPVILRDFKSEKETGGHPDFFFLGAPINPAQSITGVTMQTGALPFSKRYCVPNSSGPARQNDSTARCWDIAAATLDNMGKPTFNAARTGGNLCDCQFTDWSHLGNDGHVPGYTQAANGPTNGLVYTAGKDGHPMYKGPAPIVKDATSFGQWWVDGSFTNNTHTVTTLQLSPFATGQYRFSSDPNSITGGFFPLDPPGNIPPPGMVRVVPMTNEPLLCNLWPYWYSSPTFGAGASCKGDQYLLPPSLPAGLCTKMPDGTGRPACWDGLWAPQVQGTFHDSWYSSEVRYLFNFTGDFELQFYGDDDLFIFINGRLAIDLGGVHQRLPGRVRVAGATGIATIIEGGEVDPVTGIINDCAGANPYTLAANNGTCVGGTCDCRTRTLDLGLTVGKTYEIAVFHADRHPTESNYQLTLSGFATNRSNCQARCGDGVVTGAEECDDGDKNDDSVYGGCTKACKFGPFCGDGTKNGMEECDMGRDNVTSYGARDGCTVKCALPHFCGDASVDTANGEQCDQGKDINGTTGSLCDSKCQIGIQ